MRLACGDHSFPLLDHDLVLDLVAGLGFEGFDLALMGNRSHIRPEEVRHDIVGAATAVAGRVRSRGLELSDLFVIPWTDFAPHAPNNPDAQLRSQSRALFADMLEFAVVAGAPGITMVPGIEFEGVAHADSLALAAEELQWRADRAAAADKTFSVECHIGSVAASPADVLTLLDAAPDLLLTLDYTHFVAQGHLQSEVDALIPRARHVQVRGGRPGRGQCGMRDNTIDYEAVVDRLAEAGYGGFLSVEYVWIEWEHMNECDTLSETIMMRDRLTAKLQGRPWQYPTPTV